MRVNAPPGRRSGLDRTVETAPESLAGDDTSVDRPQVNSGRSDVKRSSIWPRQWAQIRERRRAARELDRLLGTPSRPNVAEVYGLRGGDDGFC